MSREASRWSANRILQDQSPLFVLDNIAQKPEAEPVYFTGEMVGAYSPPLVTRTALNCEYRFIPGCLMIMPSYGKSRK